MVFPGIPPAGSDEPPRRRSSEDQGHDNPDDDIDISRIRRQPPGDDLSQGDWLLCIFCSGIGCILGIVRVISGRPGGGKMIALSLAFGVMWRMVFFVISEMGPR